MPLRASPHGGQIMAGGSSAMVRQLPGAVVPVISHTRLIRGDGQAAQQRCPGCPQVRGSPGEPVTGRQMPDGILAGAAIAKAAGKGR